MHQKMKLKLEVIKDLKTYDSVGYDVLLDLGIPNHLIFNSYCSINHDLDAFILDNAEASLSENYQSDKFYILRVSLGLLVSSPKYLSLLPQNFYFDINSNCFLSSEDFTTSLYNIRERIFIDGLWVSDSSFSVLEKIRPYGIKIDRSILDNRDEDINRYTKRLQKDVGAEMIIFKRVETTSELDRLKSLGAEYAHGYVFFNGGSNV